MYLHNNREDFENLIRATSQYKKLKESDIERDYYIVLMLSKLIDSEYSELCVFKGGTSLSKCYPGSIERFSEDIDLTYIPKEKMNDKDYSKELKAVERIMTAGATLEKIAEERNNRNKSSFVYFGDDSSRIKLEIGSSVRPEPYSKRNLKCYIQEFLEYNNMSKKAAELGLNEIIINNLNIERTFVDKLMSVKRHAVCETLNSKVRHIYDVYSLFQLKEIQDFVVNIKEFKQIIILTKDTDKFYLEKRNPNPNYNPKDAYGFDKWADKFDDKIKKIYENLHNELLYTNEKQNFEKAKNVFIEIGKLLDSIGQ